MSAPMAEQKGRMEVLAQLVEAQIGDGTRICGTVLRQALRDAREEGLMLAAGIAMRARCDGCFHDIHDYIEKAKREAGRG